MTSTLTGPFDLCVELTDAALSGFASAIFRDQTQTISIPPDNLLSLVGQAVLDIQSASIAAAPSSSQPAGATVTITFVDSSLAFSSPQTAFAEPLSGTIVVSGVPFALVLVAGGQQDLELDFTATSVSAHWDYEKATTDFTTAHDKIRTALLEVFATHMSYAVQQTMFEMGKAALAACPQITKIDLQCPNKHRIPVNLAPFGLENKNEIFVWTDDPFGNITATVTRD